YFRIQHFKIIYVGKCYFVLQYFHWVGGYKYITVAVFIVVSILQGVRLFLGYLGNLAQKIPELTSFWLISVFIIFPLEVYILVNSITAVRFSETIINSIMLLTVTVEIVTGALTLNRFANHYTKRFYV
ncbi:Transmembrane protein 17, partial [Harpegnathos saltator]